MRPPDRGMNHFPADRKLLQAGQTLPAIQVFPRSYPGWTVSQQLGFRVLVCRRLWSWWPGCMGLRAGRVAGSCPVQHSPALSGHLFLIGFGAVWVRSQKSVPWCSGLLRVWFIERHARCQPPCGGTVATSTLRNCLPALVSRRPHRRMGSYAVAGREQAVREGGREGGV